MIKSIYFKETTLDLRSLLIKHFMHKKNVRSFYYTCCCSSIYKI